jgi:hypothetical protein
MEEGTASCNSGSFVLLTVPRERTPNPGGGGGRVAGMMAVTLQQQVLVLVMAPPKVGS